MPQNSNNIILWNSLYFIVFLWQSHWKFFKKQVGFRRRILGSMVVKIDNTAEPPGEIILK